MKKICFIRGREVEIQRGTSWVPQPHGAYSWLQVWSHPPVRAVKPEGQSMPSLASLSQFYILVFFNYFINPGCGPNSLVRLAVSVSANFEIIPVKSALSRFANWKIRAFCRRKDFLAQCVSSFSCSRIFQFVAEPLQHYTEKTICLKLWTAVTPVFHYVSTVFL